MSDNVPPSGLGWGAPENLPPKSDPDEARVRRYAEAIEDHAEARSEPGYNRWRCICGEVIATIM